MFLPCANTHGTCVQLDTTFQEDNSFLVSFLAKRQYYSQHSISFLTNTVKVVVEKSVVGGEGRTVFTTQIAGGGLQE